MERKEKFDKLVKALRSANETCLFDETLTILLDHIEGCVNVMLVNTYLILLEDICVNKGLSIENLLVR